MSITKLIVYFGAYAILAGFFLIEHFVRQGSASKNMERTESDKGSTTLVSIVMAVAFILIPSAPLLTYLNIGGFSSLGTGIAGIALGALGLVIRYQAFTTLGRFFTRVLRQTDEHRLVTEGIYRYIRHPGYLSDLLIFSGASLAMQNWLPVIIVPVLFIPAYVYRISVEEQMLIKIFGADYLTYQGKTKRLIPYVF